MRRNWLSPVLSLALGISSTLVSGGLEAATEAERDEHFKTIAQVVDKELYLVAKRALAGYEAAGYPDPGGLYQSGIRLHFASSFAVSLAGAEAEKLGAEAKELRAKLKGAAGLPELVKPYVDDAGQIKRLAFRLLKDFNPDAPPPNIAFTEAKQGEVEARFRLLAAGAGELVDKLMAEVARFDKEVVYSDSAPSEGAEYEKMVQNAILKRVEVTEAMRVVMMPLREISFRGKDFGLSATFIKEVDAWCGEFIAKRREKISGWEWEYGYIYMQLRHGCAFLLGEYVRLKIRDESLVTRHEKRKAPTNYESVAGNWMDAVDTDLSGISEKFRPAIERYKLQIWNDLLTWHLQLDTDEAHAKGIELWENLQQRAKIDDTIHLGSSDKMKAQYYGACHLTAARLFGAAGDQTTRNGLLADVQNKDYKNVYAPNAKKWMTYQGSGSQAGSWESQPRPLDPSRAVTVARAFIAEAQRATDAKLIEKFYTDAASTLRDGIRGLPDETDSLFVEQAPTLYQLYAYTLAKRGWAYRAAIASLEGLHRFRPDEWKDGLHPDWTNRRGDTLTSAGVTVQTLAGQAMTYSQSLISRAGGAVAKDTLNAAIEFMRSYDPENVEDTAEFLQVIIHMQEGEFREARELAEKIGKSAGKAGNKVLMLKALRFAVDAAYRYWQTFLENELADEKRMQQAESDLDKLVGMLSKFTDPARWSGQEESISEDVLREFKKGWQMVATVQVGKRFKAGEYAEVIDTLNGEFWANVPRDQELIKKLLTFSCGSAYKMNRAAAEEMKALNDKMKTSSDRTKAALELIGTVGPTLLANWGRYRQAHKAYTNQIKRFPGLQVETLSLRKQMSQVFNVSERQVKYLVQNLRGLAANEQVRDGLAQHWLGNPEADKLTELVSAIDRSLVSDIASLDAGAPFDLALLESIGIIAKGTFADLYYPILKEKGEDENITTLVAIADNLWDIDDKERAVELYEMYLTRAATDEQMTSYLADKEGVVSAFGAKIGQMAAGNHTIRGFFADEKGTIRDFLIDKPGFVDQFYLNDDVDQEDFPEEKEDYGRAYLKLKELRDEIIRQRSRIGQADEMVKEVDGFTDVIKNLALLIKVKGRLVEGYMLIGESAKAVDMAQELYQYDPLNSTYMQAYVDGVLTAVTAGHEVSKEQLIEAREVAARKRELDRRGDPAGFWIASLQLLQLSIALSDVDLVNRTLRTYGLSNKQPAEKLMKPVAGDFELGYLGNGEGAYLRKPGAKPAGRLDRNALAIVKRYISIYNFSQAQHKPFIAIEEQVVTDPDDPTIEKTVFVVYRKAQEAN